MFPNLKFNNKFCFITSTIGLEKKHFLRTGALVLWFWETTRAQEVMGLNPGAVYWMNVFHIYLL